MQTVGNIVFQFKLPPGAVSDLDRSSGFSITKHNFVARGVAHRNQAFGFAGAFEQPGSAVFVEYTISMVGVMAQAKLFHRIATNLSFGGHWKRNLPAVAAGVKHDSVAHKQAGKIRGGPTEAQSDIAVLAATVCAGPY